MAYLIGLAKNIYDSAVSAPGWFWIVLAIFYIGGRLDKRLIQILDKIDAIPADLKFDPRDYES